VTLDTCNRLPVQDSAGSMRRIHKMLEEGEQRRNKKSTVGSAG
jgi:hypothetical protein